MDLFLKGLFFLLSMVEEPTQNTTNGWKSMKMVEARSMQLAHIPTALRSKKDYVFNEDHFIFH